ncbi:MAG: spoIIIAB [Firmicutes bacterium]|nr:spoIIIAB [Bacillota bacterium]
MWVKLIGCCLVIFTGTWGGFMIAARYVERPKQIRQLIGCIASLGSYINYAALPLAEALERSTATVDGPVRDFFTEIATIINTKGWVSPGQAFVETLSKMQDKLAIYHPEREIILMLGASLGAIDRNEQQKQLDLAKAELEKIHREAIVERDQNVKMYRYLGVCAGLTTAILLV